VYSDRIRRWVVMKRLPGLAINPEYETWRRCPYDEREFGLILGTLHSIAPRGWGPIDDYGNSLFGTWTEFLVAAAESAIETSANRGALPVPLAARLTKQWVPRLRALEPRVPSLLHLESLGFANILYDPDTRKITGLLDFEDCIGGDPLFERAWMEFYFEHDGKDQTHFDFARFEAGYGPIVRDDARALLYRPFPYLDKLRWIDPQGARTQLYCRKLEELA
jgi:aminoglycoside phosphotransferase (APT) family kinase protein